MPGIRRIALVSLAAVGLVAAAAAAAAAGRPARRIGGPVEVPAPVAKIFQRNCTAAGCHSGSFPAMNMSLEASALPGSVLDRPSLTKPGAKIIDLRAPDKSYLLAKIRGDAGIAGKRMPFDRRPLSEADIKNVTDWILSLKKAEEEDGDGAEAPGPAAPASPPYDKPAFWGTTIINLPTATPLDRGRLLFHVGHRFILPVSSGAADFWGLGGSANVLLGLAYGLTDAASVSVARSGLYKTYELGLHWTAIRQGDWPFSAAVHAGLAWLTDRFQNRALFDGRNIKLSLRLALVRQLSRRLSLAVVPSFASHTEVLSDAPRGTAALGLGGRWMFAEDWSLIGEWVPVLAGYRDLSNAWGLGLEKKIGGHVFQLFLTNAPGLTADQTLPGGDFRLRDGDVRLGFTIHRTF